MNKNIIKNKNNNKNNKKNNMNNDKNNKNNKKNNNKNNRKINNKENNKDSYLYPIFGIFHSNLFWYLNFRHFHSTYVSITLLLEKAFFFFYFLKSNYISYFII